MPLHRRQIEFEFSPAVLAERIVRGAVGGDMVRMHGAIVAAFEIHQAAAERDVFLAARALAGEFGTACHLQVSEAIASHTNHRILR